MAVIFALTAFLALFLRQFSEGCFGLSIAPTNPNVTVDGLPVARGLHAEVVKSLPTYFYSNVKEHRKGKVELECAVCLSEFLDAQVLRVLPGCSHVFHPRCIDQWLLSHVTCPICRQNLESGFGAAKEHFVNVRLLNDESDGSQHATCIDRDDDEDEEEKENKRNNIVGKLPRSHSTGYSLANSEVLVHNNLVNRSSYGGEALTPILSPRSTYV